MTDETTVTRNDDASRYELRVGDTVGGFAAFVTDRRGRVVMTHTEIDPEFKGRGLGSILVDEALSDLARRGDVVVPRCPFVVHYLEGNEVAGLIVDWPNQDAAQDAATPGEQPA
jgi:predicted GNAT family acetyltransferase